MSKKDIVNKAVLLHWYATGQPISFMQLAKETGLHWQDIDTCQPQGCQRTKVDSPVKAKEGTLLRTRRIRAYEPSRDYLHTVVCTLIPEKEVQRLLDELLP